MTNKTTLPTSYAPAERASEEKLKLQHNKISTNSKIKKVLEAVPEAVFILNKERQIIYVNANTLDLLKIREEDLLCGLRPGDAFECENAQKTAGGCGTTEFCRYCAAVNTILASQQKEVCMGECRITKTDGSALDLRVKASPFYDDDNEFYTIFSINDISDEKRKQVLERLFFHDILNTAGALNSYSDLLMSADTENKDKRYKSAVCQLSKEIIDELYAQKQLMAAENGDLKIKSEQTYSREILASVVCYYRQHEVAEEKTILLTEDSESVEFYTDTTLLSRVLGNLIKNALESSEEGETVTVSCGKVNDRVEFRIKNNKVMSHAIQMQLFQRSFSTKGKGRGLGTYSIRLLTERYLNGTVHFTSKKGEGTTFTAQYPIKQETSTDEESESQ